MSLNRNIPIKNIYYMLSYAFQSLQEQGFKQLDTEEFKNMGDLYAAIICKGTSMLIKRGLFKEYVPYEETMYAIKGKVRVAETIKSSGYFRKQMICEYDDFSVNSYLNQIIKTTAMLLMRSDISKERKKQIKDLMAYFSEVEELDRDRINWKINYNRNNATYQMLIIICKMVIKDLLHTEHDGSTKLAEYLDPQQEHRLYEKFILEYYRKEHKDIKANAIKIGWALDAEDIGGHLPDMQTDITLQSKDERKTLIIDAKYYTHNMQTKFDKDKVHSGNLYQIYTYVKNLEARNSGDKQIAGMLLYSKTLDQVQPDDTYYMSGNTIKVRTLDLSKDFEDIRQQLDEIYENFVTGNIYMKPGVSCVEGG